MQAPPRHPSCALGYPDAPVVGAEAMHRVLRGWLAAVGQDAYRLAVPPAVEGDRVTP